MRSGLFAVKSGDADVLGLRTLGASGDVELDLLVLVERLVTAGLDGGVVDEDVLAAAVLCNETETLLGVEPLDGSLSHVLLPYSCRGQCALKLLKTPTCADVQRTEDQEYEIQAATSCTATTACRAVPSTGPTLGHRVRVQGIGETRTSQRARPRTASLACFRTVRSTVSRHRGSER